MRSMHSFKAACTVALTVATVFVAGCQTSHSSRTRTTEYKESPQQQEPAAPSASSSNNNRQVRTSGARYSYRPQSGADMSVVGLPFPTGDEATSALLLHQVMPMEARKGAEFPIEYHVTNVTDGTLQNVALLLESQSNLSISEASPEPMNSQNGLVWNIGDLGPRETEVIYAMAVADSTGQAGNCVSVSYNNSLCAVTQIVDPELTIAKEVTPKVLRCDPITITYTVCNTGTGIATDVAVKDTLPRGITVDGKSSVNVNVGSLAAGECRDVTVVAEASGTGNFCSPASATPGGGLTAQSNEPCTEVVQPVLSIECESRERQYFRRNARFNFTVTNDGDGVSANTVVTASMPGGAEFIGASRGGQSAGGNVSWALGSLQPGETRTVWVDLTTNSSGNVVVNAAVNGDCAEADSTRCSTIFEGIPAILLEAIDLVDPVEVGDTTTYRITVTNQGTAPDTEIVVKCTLPGEQEFVSAAGATDFRRNGQVVTFRPVPSLAPGAQAVWELTIRATDAGDVRFAIEMTSALKTNPVRETESTTQYR